jgi:Transglycosylase SLT domain
MKKILLSTLMLSALVGFGSAQTRARYAFDNFDTSKGVEVVSPASKNIEKPVSAEKKLVKKTVKNQKTTSMQDAVSMQGNNVQSTVQTYSKVSMVKGSSLGGFTTGNPQYDSYIVESSKRYSIDPMLMYSQMHQESGFKLKATSNKGASGLMQLMPPTARRFGVTDIYDPQQNIDAGVKYMRWLLDKFGGDVRLALAGYNAGEGAVMKYGNQIPPYKETQEYVRRITARYNSIRNPNFVQSAKKVTVTQVAEYEKKEAAPLTTIERNTIAVRLPDGRMRLVNR